MKKAAAAATALLFILILPFSAHASRHAPSGTLTDRAESAEDYVFVFDISADSYILENERTRTAALEKLRAEGKTDKDIPSALLNPVEITVKAETQFGLTGLAKSVPVTSEKTEVSLTEDIMPSLVGENASIDSRLLDGFYFTLSLCYTVFDGVTRRELSGESFGESEKTESFYAPQLWYIGYVLPNGAVNSEKNVSFGFSPLKNDVLLYAPSRPGFTFTGWTAENGEYAGTVPAGTKSTVLKSNWDDRSFAIKYVLTTAGGYNFKNVDNSANPTSYAPAVGAKLVSPPVPKGWRFMGWTDENGAVVTEIPKGTLGDIVLRASWLTEDAYIDRLISDAHWCDVDSDGEVTVKDARAVLRAAVEIEELPAGTLSRVDFAGQGRADVTQARFILRIAVGLDTVRGVLEYYEYEFN